MFHLNNKGQSWLWILIIVIIVAIVLVAVFWPSGSSATEVIKIGFTGPLTGDIASWGQNALAGVTLAVNEINSNDGIDGKKIKVFVEDDKGGSDAATTVTKLISADNVDGIVFASGSGAGGAGLPVAEKNKVPTVIAFASAPNLTNLGDYSFRVYPSDSLQGKATAKYIFNILGKKNVAVIFSQNEWGQGVSKVFKDSFESLGGKVVYYDSTPLSTNDFTTIVEKIKSSNPEVIYAPQHPTNQLAMLKAMKDLGYNVQVVGGDVTDGEEVVSSDLADGVLYSVPIVNVPEGFKVKINSLNGFENLKVNLGASQAYDATKILLNAIKSAGTTDKEKVKLQLQKTKYAGVSTPLIEFDSQGDLKSGVFEIRIIKNKKSETYYKE